FISALSHPCTGGRPKIRMIADVQRPRNRPSRAALSPLRISSQSATPAPPRPATPASPAVTRPALGLESKSTSARASTGSPSLAKLLNRPDTRRETEVRDREKPQDEFI